MRLVGLPGEELFIKDGAIWIDGTRLNPPAEIAPLQFTDARERSVGETWGSPERPAKLGADEYFVLGDFALRSSDSRVWTYETDGHPPYAVPRSYIEGVVTLIYWPPGRWRVFR
jgi:hypothetical protein